LPHSSDVKTEKRSRSKNIGRHCLGKIKMAVWEYRKDLSTPHEFENRAVLKHPSTLVLMGLRL